MKRKFIPVTESFAKWEKEPGYVAAYSALGAEFDDPEEGLRQGLEDIAEGAPGARSLRGASGSASDPSLS
jgi:hypothetical protein